MLGKMREIEKLADVDSPDSAPESICACVAKIFHVRERAGAIPLSSSAVAARTARTKQAELFNDFTQLLHYSIFALVKLGDTGLDAQVIQKVMSAPVPASSGRGIDVIQVSRTAPPSRGRAGLHSRRSTETGIGRSLRGWTDGQGQSDCPSNQRLDGHPYQSEVKSTP